MSATVAAPGRHSTATAGLPELAARLRAASAGVTRVLFASSDGLPLYDDTGADDAARLAAVCATVGGLGISVAGITRQGAFADAVLRSDHGSLLVWSLDAQRVLGVLTEGHANVGLLQHTVRSWRS